MAALVAYLRVPKEADADDVARAQEVAIRAWARTRRHRIVAALRDANGGVDGPDRAGLRQALATLRDGAARGLVLYRLHDLADDLVTQEQLLAEIRRLGGRVYTVTGPAPGDPDETRQVVRQVLEAAARNEASILALRSAPTSPVVGPAPFGYRATETGLQPHPAEQAALARLTELRATGASLREIARALDAEGHQPRRAARWHPESLRRIIVRVAD